MPMEDSKNFPTMIIPHGTEVSVNEQGQLSIKTPGNLVIQNSGVYSVIESGAGSVRIDPNVQVEAISVEAAAARRAGDCSKRTTRSSGPPRAPASRPSSGPRTPNAP